MFDKCWATAKPQLDLTTSDASNRAPTRKQNSMYKILFENTSGKHLEMENYIYYCYQEDIQRAEQAT